MNDRLLTHDVRAARERLKELGRWYAGRPRAGGEQQTIDALVAFDADLAEAARLARIGLVADIDRQTGPFAAPLLQALLDVPRERFVRASDIAESADDTPLLLDDGGLSTVSAPHAYLLSFRLLGLTAADQLAELGTGSGYGAALASHIVGAKGSVCSIEIDGELAGRAARLLSGYGNITTVWGEAGAHPEIWGGFARVVVTFAVDELMPSWTERLPEGGRLVVPVGRGRQRLLLVERRDGAIVTTDHGAVRYVANRELAPSPAG